MSYDPTAQEQHRKDREEALKTIKELLPKLLVALYNRQAGAVPLDPELIRLYEAAQFVAKAIERGEIQL
jgi:hypothetical protein